MRSQGLSRSLSMRSSIMNRAAGTRSSQGRT
nr:MAG TPA: hypothetical protein [Caudoviricetes sp.]